MVPERDCPWVDGGHVGVAAGLNMLELEAVVISGASWNLGWLVFSTNCYQVVEGLVEKGMVRFCSATLLDSHLRDFVTGVFFNASGYVVQMLHRRNWRVCRVYNICF